MKTFITETVWALIMACHLALFIFTMHGVTLLLAYAAWYTAPSPEEWVMIHSATTALIIQLLLRPKKLSLEVRAKTPEDNEKMS